MIDTFTSTVTAAAAVERNFGQVHGDDVPSRSDLMDEGMDLSEMTPCPFGCSARFHGESTAFRRHADFHDTFGRCESFWS